MENASRIKALDIQNWKGKKDTGAVNNAWLGRRTGCERWILLEGNE